MYWTQPGHYGQQHPASAHSPHGQMIWWLAPPPPARLRRLPKLSHGSPLKIKSQRRCIAAIQHAAPHVNWQFIYSEAQVGRHFLDNYSYFELIEPTGHFHSDKCNAYIAYWSPDLYYPAHHHASEELYFVLSDAGMFESDGYTAATSGTAKHRFHASHQLHAMTTTDSAILPLVL